MSHRLFQFALFSILVVLLLQPVVESFDTWDAAGPSNDTELAVAALAIGIGLVLMVGHILVGVVGTASADTSCSILRPEDIGPLCESRSHWAFASSKPLVPLRI